MSVGQQGGRAGQAVQGQAGRSFPEWQNFNFFVPSVMAMSVGASVTWSLASPFCSLHTPVSNREKCWLLLTL